MGISKKKYETMQQDDITKHCHINVLESQIKVLKHALYACKVEKCQAIANFYNVKEHNSELQDQIDYLERYTKGLEDLL